MASATENHFTGHIFLRNSRYFIAEEYRALVPVYALVFADPSIKRELCLANRQNDCPRYVISYSRLVKVEGKMSFLNVKVLQP